MWTHVQGTIHLLARMPLSITFVKANKLDVRLSMDCEHQMYDDDRRKGVW